MMINKSLESGAAAVETALLSLVMVPMVIYAIFFFDLSLINIKVLEAARYAAWELTSMRLSDWKNHSHMNGEYVGGKINVISSEVKARWGDDLNGATSSDSNLNSFDGIYNESASGLSVTVLDEEGSGGSSDTPAVSVDMKNETSYEQEQEVNANTESAPSEGVFFQDALGKIQELLGKGASEGYEYFKFNTKGFVRTEVTARLKFNRTAPIYKGENLLIGGIPIVRSKQKLIVDSWDLKDGRDVDFGQIGASSDDGGAGEEFHGQIKKMVFVGFTENIAKVFGDVGGMVQEIFNKIGLRNPFTPVVRSYALKEASDGSDSCEKNKQACFTLEDNRANPVGGALNKFYTNVFKDTYEAAQSPYYQVYKKHGKGYYMGCDKPEVVDRQDCWKN